MNPYEEKKRQLSDWMIEHTKSDTLLAFSGGADSSLLLYLLCEAAAKNQTRVYAATIQTTLHPVCEAGQAKQLAEDAGAIHTVLQVDELEEAGVSDNPTDRCYRCKKYLFTQLKEYAAKHQIPLCIEGTNEDDLHVYRPGIRAVHELGIASPLAEVHMTKKEVRRLAAEHGIAVADKPSMPCLATRFPYGTHLSYADMRRVEQAEDQLREMGFYNVRVRVHGDVARIEVDTCDFGRLMEHRTEVVECMKEAGFLYITLDLEGFVSGSMDKKILMQGE